MNDTSNATTETAPNTSDLPRRTRSATEGTRCKGVPSKYADACAVKPRKVKPSVLQRGVALFILVASIGCAAWAILEEADYPAAAAVLAGGFYLAARLGGVLSGG